MGKFYDEIPESLIPWVENQKVFWVASAPLSPDGFINVSPKGVEGTFHIVDTKTAWYEDISGSGVETIAHMRENGRITILFNAFEGPPRIFRIFGRGHVYEFGTPEYEELLPLEKRQPGSRSVIMIDVLKIGTSCGFGVPFYTFRGHRNRLVKLFASREAADVEAECKLPSVETTGSNGSAVECLKQMPPRPQNGLKRYWMVKNPTSLNGLPGVLSAHESTKPFEARQYSFPKDDERVRSEMGLVAKALADLWDAASDGKVSLAVAFVAGITVGLAYAKYL